MPQKQKYIDSPKPVSRNKLQQFVSKSGLGIIVFATLYFGVFQNLQHAYFSEKLIVNIEKRVMPTPERPFLPDITNITIEAIEKKVPAPKTGVVVLDRIDIYPEFRKFLEGDAPRLLRLIQRRINPRALVVKEGNYTWNTLYEQIKPYDPNGAVIRKEEGDNIYTLRLPLLVLEGASLTISGDEVSELRLSREANSYLVNAGDFFIIRTKVVGWKEENSMPTKFVDKNEFRPFIASWDGGNLYLAGSHFESLGYLKGKSYGISFSACTPCAKVNPNKPASTGVLVGNRFVDLFYGFYSYEAEDVAIVGNVYEDNIIYAIDPHDRSKRLIIANNETYGTKKKHGIIVSREVNDSWIFGNYSHHNRGSGIMIDRTSVNNVIAENIVEYNEQDGLTFFESQNNTTWNNTLRYNQKNGIRIRNSWDIMLYQDKISSNDGTAIEVYTTALEGQETRDFELDPYTQKASAIVDEAKISTSGASVFKITNAELLGIANTEARTATHLFPVSYSYDENLVRENINKTGIMVRISSENYPQVDLPEHPEKTTH